MRKFLFICFMVVSMPAYSITCINDYGGDNSCVNNKDTAGDCITLGYSSSNVSGCVQYVRCPFNSEYKRCVLTSSGSSVDCAKVGFTATDKTSWCAPDKIIKCPADESLTLCDGVNLKIFDCAELGFTDADKSSWCIDIVKCPTDDRFSLCNVAGSPAEDVTEPDDEVDEPEGDPETCEGVSTGSDWTLYADSCFEKYSEPHTGTETVTTPSGNTLTCQVCCKYNTSEAFYKDYPNATFKTGLCIELDGCQSGYTMVNGACEQQTADACTPTTYDEFVVAVANENCPIVTLGANIDGTSDTTTTNLYIGQNKVVEGAGHTLTLSNRVLSLHQSSSLKNLNMVWTNNSGYAINISSFDDRSTLVLHNISIDTKSTADTNYAISIDEVNDIAFTGNNTITVRGGTENAAIYFRDFGGVSINSGATLDINLSGGTTSYAIFDGGSGGVVGFAIDGTMNVVSSATSTVIEETPVEIKGTLKIEAPIANNSYFINRAGVSFLSSNAKLITKSTGSRILSETDAGIGDIRSYGVKGPTWQIEGKGYSKTYQCMQDYELETFGPTPPSPYWCDVITGCTTATTCTYSTQSDCESSVTNSTCSEGTDGCYSVSGCATGYKPYYSSSELVECYDIIGSVFYSSGEYGPVSRLTTTSEPVGVVYHASTSAGTTVRIVNLNNLQLSSSYTFNASNPYDSNGIGMQWGMQDTNTDATDYTASTMVTALKKGSGAIFSGATETTNISKKSVSSCSYSSGTKGYSGYCQPTAAKASLAFYPPNVSSSNSKLGAGKWHMFSAGEWAQLCTTNYTNVSASSYDVTINGADSIKKVNTTLSKLSSKGYSASTLTYIIPWLSHELTSEYDVAWYGYYSGGSSCSIGNSNAFKQALGHLRVTLEYSGATALEGVK